MAGKKVGRKAVGKGSGAVSAPSSKGRNRKPSKRPGSRTPKIVSHRGRGSFKLRMALWRVRRVTNRIHPLGFRFYPLYIFGMGICFGISIPPYVLGGPAYLSTRTVAVLFLVFFLPFLYYTYRWLRWNHLRKRAALAMYAAQSSPRYRRGVVYRVQRRSTYPR